jgi:hypothetical protein
MVTLETFANAVVLRTHPRRRDDLAGYAHRMIARMSYLTVADPRAVVQDCVFLAVVVACSLVLYVGNLGYYSDDWGYLSLFTACTNQSYLGLLRCLGGGGNEIPMRPIQSMGLVGLYRLFRLDPLGYHIFNAAVFVAAILLLYLTLRELQLGRLLALVLPLVYALLPHYATDRFWVAAFQANISMFFCFLSFYSALKATRAGKAGQGASLWSVLCIGALLLSSLAYEVSMPLFLLIPPLVFYRRHRVGNVAYPETGTCRASVPLVAGSVFVLLLTIGFKALTQTGTNFQFRFLNRLGLVFKHSVVQALDFNYGRYGLGLPLVMWRILRHYFDARILTLAAALGVGILAYLWYALDKTEAQLPERSIWMQLMGAGLIIYGLAYIPFFVNPDVNLTTTGVANRISIAAAVGAAFSLVGLLGWVTTFLPGHLFALRTFCVFVTLLCVTGFMIINTLASFWITAYQRQRAIVADISSHVPTLPSESTLILDGVCPYLGPGIVFEASWDLTGALEILYRDPSLHANVVTPSLKLTDKGLSMTLYDNESYYLYGEGLFLYNLRNGTTYRFRDSESARRYFATSYPNGSKGCPVGREGFGVPVF